MADRRRNIVMTLIRRNKYMLTFANQSHFWRDFCSAMAESWKKLKISNMVSSFIVCSNQNRLALVRDLLSYYYNSLFVGQLYEDKSLALRAPNCELLLNKSLLELIYFLNQVEMFSKTTKHYSKISGELYPLKR